MNKILKTIALLFLLQGAAAQSYNSFKTDLENYAQLLRLPTLAVGVARGDSLIFFKSIGSASSEKEIPISPEHIFTIASVTKTFTSVVLQQLESEGRISLNDLIDKYPNKYFDTHRWDKNTTLAHVLSHTSESDPIGTNFVYNGSKFNLVFNVFAKLNAPTDMESITRPFTKEIERRILNPLNMDHTLTRYSETQHSHLKKFVVVAYDFDESTGKYLTNPINLPNIESGPAYGMMSSVTDLIRYSRGLDNEVILTNQRYENITGPFYPNSVHGLGWFTSDFEGFDIDWAYGYGFNDSAIFFKVPSKKLTLILLSSCTMPSETAKLGYGNPLNSPVVSSFIKNFVLELPGTTQLQSDIKSWRENILKNTDEYKTRVYIEEAFAMVATTLFSKATTIADKEKSALLLRLLTKDYPNDMIWQSATAIELMASSRDEQVLNFASHVTEGLYRNTNDHPAKIYFGGLIREKSGKMRDAIQLYKMLADGSQYREQVYKFDAMMKLAKYFQKSKPELSRSYLDRLVKYKEYIGVQDDQYMEAKDLLSKL